MYYYVMPETTHNGNKQPQHSCVQRVWDAAQQANLRKFVNRALFTLLANEWQGNEMQHTSKHRLLTPTRQLARELPWNPMIKKRSIAALFIVPLLLYNSTVVEFVC